MREAQFDVFEANVAFLRDAAVIVPSLNGWFTRRWAEEGRRLKDGRGRRRPLTGPLAATDPVSR